MKKLALTERLRNLLAKAAEGIDPEKVSVYECIAVNSLPIEKRGLWNGARVSSATLNEMAQFLKAGNTVPIHFDHVQEGQPYGKAFDGEFFSENGVEQCRVLFYVGNEHEKLIAGLENSSVDEVSIGLLFKHLTCSECGWDYMGPEATMDHFWNETCENGHTVGDKGVHVNASGVDKWYELSLVSRGASRGAKIVGKSRSILGETEYNRLAATGKPPELLALFASPTQPPENFDMDAKDLLAQLTAQSGELGATKQQLTALQASLTAKTTEATEAAAKLAAEVSAHATTKTELDGLKGSDTQAKLKAATDDLALASKALRDRAAKLSVMTGSDKIKDDAPIAEVLSHIDSCEAKLANIPGGSRSQPGSGASSASFSAANFHVPR